MREVKLFQRQEVRKIKSDPNKMDSEYTKCDFAYRCTYPQIILKLVHSNFGGIQTHDLCLVVRLVHQRGQLKVVGSKSMHWICLETADINWLDIGGQCIQFSTAQQRWCFDIINILFLRSISFRSERSSRVKAVLISYQQPSVKYASFQKLRPTHGRSFLNITLPSDEAVSTRNPTHKIQGMYQKG